MQNINNNNIKENKTNLNSKNKKNYPLISSNIKK